MIITIIAALFLYFEFEKTKKRIIRNKDEAKIYKDLNEIYIKFVKEDSKRGFEDLPVIKKLLERDIYLLREIDKSLDLRDVYVNRVPSKKNKDIEIKKLEKELKIATEEIKELLFKSILTNLKILRIRNKKLYKTLQVELRYKVIGLLVKIIIKNIKEQTKFVENFRHEKKLEQILNRYKYC